MMNQVDLGWLKAQELEEGQRVEVQALSDSLGFSLKGKARFAPSIILRSELELFGCSSPRFTYRIYFEESPGFINIRRLKEFASRIRVKLPKDRILENQPQGVFSPSDILKCLDDKNQSCIADCLLPRPKHLPEDRYHLISNSLLSLAYGEASRELDEAPIELEFPTYLATPFVKNITLGGGLCAQACCFMAAAIMHEFASGIHGLAEISALSHSSRRRKFSISGIDPHLMHRYFSTINLSMTVQFPHAEVHPPAIQAKEIALQEFETGLKAYCLSGIPVIVPADFGRMIGFPSLESEDPRDETNLYSLNGLTPDLTNFDRTRPHWHCIVIVGCEKAANPGKTVFAFNDSNGHPFMRGRVSRIAEVGPYSQYRERLEDFQFWPVTPSAVEMPLLDYLPPACYKENCRGLRWLSYWYRQKTRLLTVDVPSEHFLLVQLKGFSGISHWDPIPQTASYMTDCWEAFRKELLVLAQQLQENYFWSLEHWVWLEFLEDTIWVWDAEVEPNATTPEECLIGRIVRNGKELKFVPPKDYEVD
jgi:hypothetical protein